MIDDTIILTHPLPPVPDSTEVRSHQVLAFHQAAAGSQHVQVLLDYAYIVDSPKGEMRRNCLHLNVVPNGDPPTNSRTDTSQESSHSPVTRSATALLSILLKDLPVDLKEREMWHKTEQSCNTHTL